MFQKLDNGITIRGWTVTVEKGPMAASADLDAIKERTGLPELPEMVFPRNVLTLAHASLTLSFSAIAALALVSHTAPGFSVAAASTWGEGNKAQLERLQRSEQLASETNKAFDWTYTSAYKGTIVGGRVEAAADGERIDYARLKQPDPILFWDDCVLYEDELSDNGEATMSVKIRVMPTCLLCLLRFFLRVDGVVFRLHETRTYIDFSKQYLLREWLHKEAPVSAVQDALGEEYPSKCRDANVVSDHLEQVQLVVERINLA